MWSSITISAGAEESLENIFSAIVIGALNKRETPELYERKNKVFKVCLPRFKGYFPFNVFYNSYALIYEVFMTLKMEEFSINQLDTLIDSNEKLILDSPYINKSKYKETQSGNIINDKDFVDIVRETLKQKMIEWSQIEVTEEQFVSSCNLYIEWYTKAMGEFTAQSMAAIMNTGFEYKKPGRRSRTYSGLDDMREFYLEQMSLIDALKDHKKAVHSVIDEEWLQQQVQNETKKDESIMFVTGIKEIDSVRGPLKRGNFIGIAGPPKGGKTRFTNYLVQVALQSGFNVCVWPVEGTKAEWEAMQIACLMAFDSRAKTSNTDEIIKISSQDILDHRYNKSIEMRQQVMAAKVLLSSNTKLGRLSFIENTANLETMFDDLQTHYDNVNQFDVLVVDQLINVMSTTGIGKTERLSEAYIKMKDFLANRLRVPALGIMPCQLKQETIDYLRRNPDESIDVTGGAETHETIRTPDDIWGLFSSKEERENNIMKIYDIGARGSAAFHDFQAKCFLQCCYFMSQEDA